jgi:hypothetical protein
MVLDRQQAFEIKVQLEQTQRNLQAAYCALHNTSMDKSAIEAMLIAIATQMAELETQLQSLASLQWDGPEAPHHAAGQGVQMQSEIQVVQRFKFNVSSDDRSQDRQAVVTRVLSNSEEGLGPEVDFYLAYWVEAHEISKTDAPTTLVFERGTDGNAYLDGRPVSITLLKW